MLEGSCAAFEGASSRGTRPARERKRRRPSAEAFGLSAQTMGLDRVRLHDLRHGFTSLLVAAVRNVRLAADLLGHSTISFTLQTYVHGDE